MQIYKFVFIRLRSSIAGNQIQGNLGCNPMPLPLTHSLHGCRAAESTSPVAFSANFLLIFSLRAETSGLFWALTRRREPEKIMLLSTEKGDNVVIGHYHLPVNSVQILIKSKMIPSRSMINILLCRMVSL